MIPACEQYDIVYILLREFLLAKIYFASRGWAHGRQIRIYPNIIQTLNEVSKGNHCLWRGFMGQDPGVSLHQL